MLEARKAVQKLKEYHPPLARREGLRLDFNENTLGCSPRVLAALRDITAEDLARYPEREPVERIAADSLNVAAGQVLLTNGVDEAIHLLCETYLEPGDEVILVTPCFSMYEIYAAATGAHVISIHCGTDFRFPADQILQGITPQTRLIAIASPNNPTGSVASRADLLRIAQAAPAAAVLVDEAYFEFHGSTVVPDIRSAPNLFVSRTFSKAYGLAGLRMGALVGPAAQMAALRRVSSPYNVNAVALALLPIALRDQDHITDYVAKVNAGRDRLIDELCACGIYSWPTQANFVLTRIGPRHHEFVSGMRQRGILVRDRSSDPGCDGCVRITIGTTEQMDLLISALHAIVSELGLTREVNA